MANRYSVCLLLAVAMCGCNRSERAELERTRQELQVTRAELSALRAEMAKSKITPGGYLEELEKLSSLMQKNVISQAEFDRRKQEILDRQMPAQATASPAKLDMDELAVQLRTLQALYSTSTITSAERDAKKTRLIQQAFESSNMQKDLETVKSLYSTSVINSADHELLKQKLLGLDDSHKH